MKNRTLSEIGELQLITHIKSLCDPRDFPSVVCGIGDDCAAFKPSEGMLQIVTTDAMVEGVHFRTEYCDPYSLGAKSLAVNLSDIAAMGGVPLHALISLSLPGNYPEEFVTQYYEGLIETAKRYGVAIIGGNITKSFTGFSSHITVIGEAKKDQLPLRGNAQAGDGIYVTGTLGDSAAGLEILKKNGRAKEKSDHFLIGRHKNPTPRVATGRKLVQEKIVGSMIDISDGLLTDLQRICKMSAIGATLEEQTIPLSHEILKYSNDSREKAVQYALHGGEDYELLFTVSDQKKESLRTILQSIEGGITRIGQITKKKGVRIIDTNRGVRTVQGKGFDHLSEHL